MVSETGSARSDRSGRGSLSPVQKFFRSDLFLFDIKPILTFLFWVLYDLLLVLEVLILTDLYQSGSKGISFSCLVFLFLQMRLSSIYFLSTHNPFNLHLKQIYSPAWMPVLWLPFGLTFASEISEDKSESKKAFLIEIVALLQVPFIPLVLLLDHINLWRSHMLLARELESEAGLTMIFFSIAYFNIVPIGLVLGLAMGLGWVAEADLGLAAGALAAAAPVLATVAATAPGQYGRWSQKLDPDGGGFLEHFARRLSATH